MNKEQIEELIRENQLFILTILDQLENKKIEN